jgi:diguanylate cyclase (GGDEF)-like protein
MRSSECNSGSPAAIRTRDGALWFATAAGLAVIDPQRIRTDPRPPRALIEEMTADGEAVSLRGPPRLPPGTRKLALRYTALGLLNHKKARFRYRLEGFDADWVEAGTQRLAAYTNLAPGSYRFRVVAANADGIWDESGAALEFELRPFLYQARWFQALFAGLLALAALGGHRYRTRRLGAQAAELARLVEERTRQLELANQTLQRLSAQDPLTGIANRRRFEEVLDLEWRRACRTATPLSLTMVDIDSFKAFNDTYGHQRGDACLQEVARALASALHRAGDLVARYGGEEFAVIQPGTEQRGAERLAEALRATVQALGIPHARSPVSDVVTISLGVATCIPRGNSTPVALVAAGDQALYRAKQEGRNRVAIDPGPP